MPAPLRYIDCRRGGIMKNILIGLLVAAVILMLAPLVLSLAMALLLHGSSKSLPPAEVSRSVATQLIHWGTFGKEPGDPRAQRTFRAPITQGIRGIQGYSTSDGFHGDGSDWYEAELSPDLMTQLRAWLAQNTTLEKRGAAHTDGEAPSWWPETWPAGTQTYYETWAHFTVPPTGTHVWFVRIRS